MRKDKLLIILACSCFSFSCCKKDYRQKQEKTVEKYITEGKDILSQSEYDSPEHYIYFLDNASVFINDFDNLEKAVLSEDKEYVIKSFYFDFDKEGIPTVKSTINSQKRKIKILKDEFQLYFKAIDNQSFTFGCTDENIPGLLNVYFHSLEKPDTLFLIKESQESDGYPISADKETVNEIYGHLSTNPLIADYKFMDSVNGLIFARGGDLLKWTVFLDKNGNIIRTGKNLIYGNGEDEFKIPVNAFITKDYTTLSKLMYKIESLLAKERHEAEQNQLNGLVEQSVSVEQLSALFRNNISAENYQGQTLFVTCEFESISRTGYFDLNGYKYKLTSSAVDLMGEWISGYDIIAYTNDDNFINMSFPSRILMQAILVYGDTRTFKFKDCQYIAVRE